MAEHTSIHFIHALAAFLMVVWFFILLTFVVAKWPDNSITSTIRNCVPLGEWADSYQPATNLQAA
jgi:hypothetical protein